MRTVTATQHKALQFVHEQGPCSCTELGEDLWRGNRHCNRQSYARPAGRVLHALARLGLVHRLCTRDIYAGGRLVRIHEWWPTNEGRKVAAAALKAKEGE